MGRAPEPFAGDLGKRRGGGGFLPIRTESRLPCVVAYPINPRAAFKSAGKLASALHMICTAMPGRAHAVARAGCDGVREGGL